MQKRIYLDKPDSVIGLFTLAALLDSSGCLVYYRPCPSGTETTEGLIKRINPRAISYPFGWAGMDAVLLEESTCATVEGATAAAFVLEIAKSATSNRTPINAASHCVIERPALLYQQLSQLPSDLLSCSSATADQVEAIDAEDIGLAAATILSAPGTHHPVQQAYRLRGRVIPLEVVRAIRHRLPGRQGDNTVAVSPCSTGSHKEEDDFQKIIPGHEPCTIVEFLKKCETSLYHQRFLWQ